MCRTWTHEHTKTRRQLELWTNFPAEEFARWSLCYFERSLAECTFGTTTWRRLLVCLSVSQRFNFHLQFNVWFERLLFVRLRQGGIPRRHVRVPDASGGAGAGQSEFHGGAWSGRRVDNLLRSISKRSNSWLELESKGSTRAFKRGLVFNCKISRLYSRERAYQSLRKIIQKNRPPLSKS